MIGCKGPSSPDPVDGGIARVFNHRDGQIGEISLTGYQIPVADVISSVNAQNVDPDRAVLRKRNSGELGDRIFYANEGVISYINTQGQKDIYLINNSHGLDSRTLSEELEVHIEGPDTINGGSRDITVYREDKHGVKGPENSEAYNFVWSHENALLDPFGIRYGTITDLKMLDMVHLVMDMEMEMNTIDLG